MKHTYFVDKKRLTVTLDEELGIRQDMMRF